MPPEATQSKNLIHPTVHMGPRSNLLSQNNCQKQSRDTVPLEDLTWQIRSQSWKMECPHSRRLHRQANISLNTDIFIFLNYILLLGL